MHVIKKYFRPLFAPLVLASLVGCQPEAAIPTPTVAGVLPAAATPNSLVVIKGEGLENMRRIAFGSTEAPFNPTYNTDGVLMVRVPVKATYGDQQITLFNAGGEANKVMLPFKVLQPLPVITKFSPSEASPGDTIVLTGDKFENVSTVSFGDKNGTVTSAKVTELKVIVPDIADKIAISVTTPGGTAVSAELFAPTGKSFYVYKTKADYEAAGWQNWSWAKVTLGVTEMLRPKGAADYAKVTFPAWSAFWMVNPDGVDVSKFKQLKCWIYGSPAGDQTFNVFYRDKTDTAPEAGKGKLVQAVAGQWTEITLDLSDLGTAPKMVGLVFQEFGNKGDNTTPVYIGEVRLQ